MKTSAHCPFTLLAATRKLALVLGLVLCASVAGAQTGVQKIAVVDMEAITRRSRSVQDAVKKAESQVQQQQDKVDAKMRDLRQMKDNLRARRSVLSETESKKQEDDILKLQDEMDDLQYDVTKQVNAIQKELMDPVVDRIIKTVQEIAKREGYTMVIRAEAVLYNEDNSDISPLVIQALDKQDQSKAPAAEATNAKAQPGETGSRGDSKK